MSIFPGVTIADTPKTELNGSENNRTSISSQPGPTINGRKTTITLLSPTQLIQSDFLPSLKDVSNEAFRVTHTLKPVIPATLTRITSDEQLLDELKGDPASFIYIIHYDNESEVVGTASGWRFTDIPVLEARSENLLSVKAERSTVFSRQELLPPGIDAWELKLMVVSPKAQKQGLASTLIDLCESEVRRRATTESRNASASEVRFILSCVEEVNGQFYRNRGFTLDSQVSHPPGTFGSTTGFHVSHMSKIIDTGTL